MPLVDATYFDGPLLLSGVNEPSVLAAVNAAIVEYEDEYLKAVMGPSLYAAYIVGIEGEGGDFDDDDFSPDDFETEVIEDRWLWVRDGHTYTYGSRSYSWAGLADAIACYVYWKYRDENATHTVGIGEASATSENATMVAPDTKMVKAWNRMVDMSRQLAHMLQYLPDEDDERLYPEFDWYEPESNVYHYQNTFGI